jgi:alpha-tubulin suppressor-like RCC1 family protein
MTRCETLLSYLLPNLPPLSEPGVTAIVIAAVSSYTCVIDSRGGVKCWGSNDHGELGIGSLTIRSNPADVEGAAREGLKSGE